MIRVWMLAVVLALPLALSGASREAAAADEVDASAPAKNGWTPGLNMSLNIFNYEGDGTVNSTVGQSTRGSGRLTVGEFRVGLDVLSPQVDLAIFETKFMVLGGIQVGPGYTVPMARVGELIMNQPDAAIRRAIIDNTMNGIPFPANSSYPGQGSTLAATYEGLGWYAGAGMEFDMPGLPDLLRIRPYALYVGEKMSATGALASVTGVAPNFVIHRSLGASEEDFHYLGPGLELDLVLTQGARLDIVLFTAGDFLFNVGDGQITMRTGTVTTDENGASVPGPPGLVTYVYDADSFRFNLQFGVRIAWRSMFGG